MKSLGKLLGLPELVDVLAPDLPPHFHNLPNDVLLVKETIS
jgi:hypothetical protein